MQYFNHFTEQRTEDSLRKSHPTELELHRMDFEAIKKAGFESPGELLAAYNKLLEDFDILQNYYDALVIDGDLYNDY